MGKKEPKPKPPTAAELAARVAELETQLRKEEAARHEMRKISDAQQKKAEDAVQALEKAHQKQLRAEEAARVAEKARLEGSKKAAVERTDLQRRLSVVQPPPSTAAPAPAAPELDAMAAEISELKASAAAQEKKAASELAAMAKLSQEKLEALEAKMTEAEQAAFSRGKKLAEESAYRRGYEDGQRERPAAGLTSPAVPSPSLATPHVPADGGRRAAPEPEPEGLAAQRRELEETHRAQVALLQAELSASQERVSTLTAELADLRRAWDVAEGHTRKLLAECQELRDAAARQGAAAATAPSAPQDERTVQHEELVTSAVSSPARARTAPEASAGTTTHASGHLHQLASTGGFRMDPPSTSAPAVAAAALGIPPLHVGNRAPPVPPLRAHKPASYHSSPRWSRALSPRSASQAMGVSWPAFRGGQEGSASYVSPGSAPQAPPAAPRQAHKPASFSTSARWTRALTPRSARGVMHFNRPTSPTATDEVAL